MSLETKDQKPIGLSEEITLLRQIDQLVEQNFRTLYPNHKDHEFVGANTEVDESGWESHVGCSCGSYLIVRGGLDGRLDSSS